MVRTKSLSYLFISLFLLSCSSGQKEKRAELRTLYAQKDFDKALQILDDPKFSEDENLKLLVRMEKGSVKHTLNHHYQANQAFNEAIDVSRKLYTEKFSQIATTGVTNDNFKDFYGEKFERSMLYFYASVTSLDLCQEGKRESYVLRDGQDRNVKETIVPEYILKPDEVRLSRQAARAQILSWDSFLSNIKNDNWGKNVFKNDILAKVYGAFVHETMNSNQDDQIALQLYKDAKDLLNRNFNIYATFNQKAKDFNSEFKKFASNPEVDVKKYIEPTIWAKDLQAFLDDKIKNLSKREKKANFKFVLQEGLIAEKVSVPINIGLKGAMEATDDPSAKKSIAAIGSTVLAMFAANKLGLVSHNNTFGQNYLGANVAQLAVNEAGIEFEVPKVQEKPVTSHYTLVIKNEKGNVVMEKPFVLVAPLSDIAHESVKEDAISRVAKTGVRVAVKHAVAIAAAFGTYQMMGGSNQDFLAKTAALASYLGASKLIAASEKADTRYWSTLPHTIRVLEASLPPGKYKAEVVMKDGDKIAQARIPDFVIPDSKEVKIISYRYL